MTRDALASSFGGARDGLHASFPAYTEALTCSGIIDVLFEVGLLGVRRGNGTVFSGGGALPVQPHESEFSVHPCFRDALGATRSGDAPPPAPATGGPASPGAAGRAVRGATAVDRDHRLLRELRRSRDSVRAQIGRAEDLTGDVRASILQLVLPVLSEDGEAGSGGSHLDAEDQVLDAVHEFLFLADALHANGWDTAAGGRDVAQRIGYEASRLRRLAGGSFGSSGSSAGN